MIPGVLWSVEIRRKQRSWERWGRWLVGNVEQNRYHARRQRRKLRATYAHNSYVEVQVRIIPYRRER